MRDFTFSHTANIIVHVTLGSFALLLAIFILIAKKGTRLHKKTGNIFLILTSIVVFTGALGVLIFARNFYLLVLTVLSGYYAYSGFRIIRLKSNTPKLIDIVVALLSLCLGIYFLYYIKSIGFIWSPGIIYATVSALFIIVAYDLLRYMIPSNKYKNLWLYEHIYKMIGAFTALLGAATGTILANYKPYSQFLPSVFGTLLAIGFIGYFYRKNRLRKNENPKKSI